MLRNVVRASGSELALGALQMVLLFIIRDIVSFKTSVNG